MKNACTSPGQGKPRTACGPTGQSVTREEVILVIVVLSFAAVLSITGLSQWMALALPVAGTTAVIVVSRREPRRLTGLQRVVTAWTNPALTA